MRYLYPRNNCVFPATDIHDSIPGQVKVYTSIFNTVRSVYPQQGVSAFFFLFLLEQPPSQTANIPTGSSNMGGRRGIGIIKSIKLKLIPLKRATNVIERIEGRESKCESRPFVTITYNFILHQCSDISPIRKCIRMYVQQW